MQTVCYTNYFGLRTEWQKTSVMPYLTLWSCTLIYLISVAHPGFFPDPNTFIIPDPGSNNSNKRGGARKKIWTNSPRITIHLTQNIVTKLSKLWVWDPGSGKNLSQIPDTGSRGKKGIGSRIRICNTGSNGTWRLSFDLLTGWPCPPAPLPQCSY